MKKLEETIKYKFKNPFLLKQAMTHSSHTSKLEENYQRLEFLGDRVLGLCVAKMLYKTYPEDFEGDLSQRFVRLVCKETIAEVALSLCLDKYAILTNDEIRNNENVLCDLCEALLGAIFMDSGYDESLKFVKTYWQKLIEKDKTPPKDAKTLLQEIIHSKNLGVPTYAIIKREGSEHEPIFHMSVSVEGMESQKGIGRNKKIAEQIAAEKMIEELGKKYDK